MKFRIIAFCLGLSLLSFDSVGQMVTGVIFTYDATGKRVKRHIGLVLPRQSGEIDTDRNSENFQNTFKDDDFLLSVYPNPTSSELTITNNKWSPSDKVHIDVLDMQGKVLMTFESSQAKEVVSFSNFLAGSYVVRYFLDGRSAKVWKIVKL